jgi:hypothetical protein
MYKDSDDDLFLLFDTAELDHVCYLLSNCHDPAPKEYRSNLSQSLGELLLAPVEKFISRLYESGRGSNASEFDATIRFRDCIENVSRRLALRKEDGEMPPAVAQEIARDLQIAWLEFIARSAAHRMYSDLPEQLKKAKKTSVRNKMAASIPRKEVTKEELEKFRENFNYRYGTYHGWLTAAEHSFEITRKTIKKRMGE